MRQFNLGVLIAGAIAIASTVSHAADVTVGIVLSTSGPAASIGIAQKNALDLAPEQLGGQHVKYIYAEEASEAAKAVSAVKKFIELDKVDLVIGPTTYGSGAAIVNFIAESHTPLISFLPLSSGTNSRDEMQRWVFRMPSDDTVYTEAIFAHMKKSNVKNLALIGFSDGLGDSWEAQAKRLSAQNGITIVANERYARSDTSVLGQVAKILSSQPDAVLVAASGTPAAIPMIELRNRGFKGKLYSTPGITLGEFRKVVGKAGEGLYFPSVLPLIPEQYPDNYMGREVAKKFVATYEAKYGVGTRNIFAAFAWDALTLADNAISVASKTAQPGTKEFREALRDAMENTHNLPAARGVLNMTPTDHTGDKLDVGAKADASVKMGQLIDGQWTLAKE